MFEFGKDVFFFNSIIIQLWEDQSILRAMSVGYLRLIIKMKLCLVFCCLLFIVQLLNSIVSWRMLFILKCWRERVSFFLIQFSSVAQSCPTLWPLTKSLEFNYMGRLEVRQCPCLGFSCSSVGKESACNAGDPGSIPGLGRSPGEGNGNPFQYPFLENLMDRGAWWTAVHGVAKNRAWLSN